MDEKEVVSGFRKIASVITGVVNWSILGGTVFVVECIPESDIKNVFRSLVYGAFIGTAVIGFLGRRKRANARLYNDNVCLHDPDSGRGEHYEYIASVNCPDTIKILINPWVVFLPIMADVVRLGKTTGSLSCTLKTIKWVGTTDGFRTNLDPIGSREIIEGDAAKHLLEVEERLNKADNLTQQQKYMKEALKRMRKNGLTIEE